jgi:hypothetical protein
MESQKMILATLTWLLVFALGSVFCISGCSAQRDQRELMLSDFDFLERDTRLEEIVDRLGWPDRFVGSGLIAYQYDLADDRIVELSFFGEQLHARVKKADGTWADLELSEKPGWSVVRHIGKWTVLALVALGAGWWLWKRRRTTSSRARC